MEKFSASRAERLMHCTASGDLEVSIPGWVPPVQDPTANNAANRGSKMHEILEELSVLSPREMDGFAKSLAYIAAVRASRRFQQLIEQTEEVTWLHQPVKTTADLVLYTADELHIIDFKWGRIPVEVVGNEQLLFYAVTYGKYAPKAKGATLHIVQPNADNFEAWDVDTTYLMTFMAAARAAEAELLAGNLEFMPGDHCTFCPANPRSRGAKGSPYCPTLMDMWYPAPFDEAAILAGE